MLIGNGIGAVILDGLNKLIKYLTKEKKDNTDSSIIQ
jgi:hypothetical protein